MPRLDGEKRQSINARLARHTAIRASFEERLYVTVHCYLCNWSSNGLTYDEAAEANRAHIAATHAAEDAEMRATEISPMEIRDSLHDHDCEMAMCACKCGCERGPFCHTVMGPLCSTCMLAEKRGNGEHGEREEGDEP